MNLHSYLIIFGLLTLLPGCVERQPDKTFTQINSVVVQNNTCNVAVETDTTTQATDNEKKPIELIFTDDEKKAIERWKRENKSMDDLATDAFNGDEIALYNLGMYNLLGFDFTINLERANFLLAKSASLGFAPAIDQIRAALIDANENNLFLALVYLNLTIAFGHTEFSLKYHDLRNKLPNDMKKIIMPEIERIADQKMALIYKNQEGLKNAKNKKEYCIKMQNITDEDSKYTYDFWLNLYEKSLKSILLSTKLNTIKLCHTTSETAELTKTKNSDNSDNIDMVLDMALKGDRSQLYVLGTYNINGNTSLNITANTQRANDFFYISASLGYAPAIYAIMQELVAEKNTCLAMIYCNLLIESGHNEFLKAYQEYKSLLINEGFIKIANEIERVTAYKKNVIQENQEKLQSTNDPREFIETKLYRLNNEDKFVFVPSYFLAVHSGNVFKDPTRKDEALDLYELKLSMQEALEKQNQTNTDTESIKTE